MAERFTIYFNYGAQRRYATAEYRIWDRQEGRTLPLVYINHAEASEACKVANADHEAISKERAT